MNKPNSEPVSKRTQQHSLHNAEGVRIKELKRIFGETQFYERINTGEGFSIREIASRIDAKPRTNYKKVQNFNISSIKDEVHGPVVPQIMHLVKYLNDMGIKTENSGWGGPAHTANIWGEWREEDEKPYLAINGENLKDIIEVLLDWENNGGKDFRIIPISGYKSDAFWINANLKTPWKDAQKEFDSLTDHIAHRFGKIDEIRRLIGKKLINQISKIISPVINMMNIVRRSIKKVFPKKKQHHGHSSKHHNMYKNTDNHCNLLP